MTATRRFIESFDAAQVAGRDPGAHSFSGRDRRLDVVVASC